MDAGASFCWGAGSKGCYLTDRVASGFRMELETLALGEALALRFEAEPIKIMCHNSMVSREPGSVGVEVGLFGAEQLVVGLSGVDSFAAFEAFSLLRLSTTWLIKKRLRLAVMRASPVRGSSEGVAWGITHASFRGL